MTEQAPAPTSPQPRRSGAGAGIVGALLVVVGLIFLAGQLFDFDWAGEVWPLYIIGAGAVMAAFGLAQPATSGLTVAGSMVTVVGLLLFYQEWADHYESWAYAWALVAPGGSGVGMFLHGTRHGNRKMARDGFWQIVTGLAIFVVGFVFFEGIIGLSGNRWNLPEWLLPAIVIGLGVILLVRAFRIRGDDGDEVTAA